jgi:hypothetical protein
MNQSTINRLHIVVSWIIALYFSTRFAYTGKMHIEIFNMKVNSLILIVWSLFDIHLISMISRRETP